MTGEPWLLHPAAVHFPIALLLAGGLAAWARLSGRAPAWLLEAELWLLSAGVLSAWAALGLGHLAEETAPHVPAAWETLAEHKALGWWTCGLFTVLLAVRVWSVRGRREFSSQRGFEGAMWLAGWGLLAATAVHGGELVYRHGMGVLR